MKDKEFATNLFLTHTGFKLNEIKKIKEIHLGYTNKSFLFVLKNKEKFQVRIGKNNQIINRNIENQILHITKNEFIYLDKNGNAIKKWIIGKNPKFIFNKKKLIKLVVEAIESLHQTNCEDLEIPTHDYFEYCNNQNDPKYRKNIKKYKFLLNKYQNLPLVFSHNDINKRNMIYQWKQKQIILIDFEWARINYNYWDYANFIKETNLKIKSIKYICKLNPSLSLLTLLDFCFIVTVYHNLWIEKMPYSKKLEKYRKKNYKQYAYFLKIKH